MARNSTRRKVHKKRPVKAYFVVFCEGESEEAYVHFLNNEFKDVASFDAYIVSNFFEDSYNKIIKDGVLKNKITEATEIWFFFDTELKDKNNWKHAFEFIQKIRRHTKKPTRLLMTTGCVEYWLLLHFTKTSPVIQTEAEKKRIMNTLKAEESTYEKGHKKATAKIAQNYLKAMVHAKEIISNLEKDGLPKTDEIDQRNKWLFEQNKTFSNVHEALAVLLELRKANSPQE